LETFAGQSAFSTWLHRLAVNVVLMERRSTGRRERRVVAVEDGPADGAAQEAPPGLRLDLERAITELPEGAREVFILHDVEGYSHEEIGAMVGIAVGTSKAHLFRARRLLREKLQR
jgi:RNA polymerase sigma-70 factor (ECF subfamily)